VVPWVLSLGISVWSGRSIFYDRYLVFAQFFLLGFWGIAWAHLPGWPARLVVSCLVGAVSLGGLWCAVTQFPASAPALVKAADFLKERYEPGDLILMNGPAALNRLRYYAEQAGIESINVRCWQSPFPARGHIVHLASLGTEDVVWAAEKGAMATARRWWVASETGEQMSNRAEGMRMAVKRTFEGGGGTRYALVLYERDK